MATTPSIACIGVIGKQDNPLLITVFPPHQDSELEFHFMLNSCLDIFEIRQNNKAIDQDLGLLQAIDERLAMYGWLTNTGVKFMIIVDMAGKPARAEGAWGKNAPVQGLRDADLKPAFRALQTAYIHLLQNPFFTPDDLAPHAVATRPDSGPSAITSQKFIKEVKRIGDVWAPGIASV
ncbi:MAG: hypothetical protein M1834_001893 [Cirrosporium novae-zelandiae]|nr:MAG: hypothetical protein M1834_001893 [Cirrosporium novae-zelandiae]